MEANKASGFSMLTTLALKALMHQQLVGFWWGIPVFDGTREECHLIILLVCQDLLMRFLCILTYVIASIRTRL